MPKVSGAMNPPPEIHNLGGNQEKFSNSEQKQGNEYQEIYPPPSYGFVQSEEQKKAFLEYQRASQEQRQSAGYGQQQGNAGFGQQQGNMGYGQQKGNAGFGQQQGNIGYGQQKGFNQPPPQSYQQNPNLKQQSSPPPPPPQSNNNQDDFQ